MSVESAALPEGGAARPLRILHIVQHLKNGGAETFVRGLTSGLLARGLDVRILSLYPDGLSPSERVALGVPIVSLERRGRADIAAFYPRLVREIRRARADVVHAHLHAGKFAGRIGAIVAGAPAIVFTEHGDEAGGPLRSAVNRVLHPRTTRFVVFSEEQREAFSASERVALERIVVIRNGVAEPPQADRERLRAELGLSPGAFAAYMPARLTSQKNHSLALRAFARAFASDSRARLVFAGAGPLEADIRAEASALGLGDRTSFLGFRDDAALLMRAMDAFLMPSLWEKMPLALGEAMRAGLPVVTSPWAGHTSFVTDDETGIVSADLSVDAFAHAIARMRDPETRRRITARARTFAAEAFGLETSVAQHAALYEQIVRA
ncbi:MAG: glycosyltransferase family 4 protein [Candidatus Eremiobacteraeota bacterium]|nr:glycosyltransferase family 4 protein [Candidatus Eremiobacteraeota bacterium]